MDRRRQLIQQAWIGDAVLTLYARLKILRDKQSIDGDACTRMTSNQFLTILGEPTQVEAQIGRIFENSGLQSAFDWIDQNLAPAFERQEQKRAKPGYSTSR